MDIFNSGPIAGLLDVMFQLVAALTRILDPVVGAGSAAVAVVLLTVMVRVLLIPVGASQVRAQFSRQRLASKLAQLQRAHGHDRAELQQKTMELYAQEKASPFAGCLPLMLQAPILSLVYALFLHSSINGHANTLLSQHLLGVPLGTSFVPLLTSAHAVFPALGVFCLLLGLIAVVIAASRKLLVLHQARDASADRSADAVTRLMSYLPFISVLFAAFVPLAAVLYLLTTTTWTLFERLALRRILEVRAA